MKTFSSTERAPLLFNPSIGEDKQKTIASTAKIGWIHSIADEAGASFDIVVRDGLGREKFRRNNCTTETKEYGELVNLETLLGEQLEVGIENLKGAKQVHVFLN